MAYEMNNPVTKQTMRTWMVVFPSKRGCCILNCTAPKSRWAEVAPEFKSIFTSLNFVDAIK
jgi:hypothetical protein